MTSVNKKQRQKVYARSGGHCWYCGCVLESKWHIDHIEPIRRGGGVCCLDLHNHNNLAPTCAPCNLLKGVYSVEEFRDEISKQIDRARNRSVNFRTAERFGLIEKTHIGIIFWFEKRGNACE